MQKFQQFSADDHENLKMLFDVFKDLQVAYLEEEKPKNGGPSLWYSCLIDGYCEVLGNGQRKPKYRILLPGPPILGDGKADNQNHAIIFTRGEVLQVIDANQDHYLEECIKIRNVLAEFELQGDEKSPYSLKSTKSTPVAIVGTREHIFSERIGGMAANAASKEFVFGTLVQRIMNRLGSRLHYGHPDFLNTVFMTTRGGLSKAQKGLHINEDIYAGYTVFQRGGRIKHTEYIQCGKGRDLGFNAILMFVRKLGLGVGEQSLSRESWHIGTRLPIDRLLSFVYAHSGFYLNCVFLVSAIPLLFAICILANVLTRFNELYCSPEKSNCFSLNVIEDWTSICVITMAAGMLSSFIPLFLQLVTETGVMAAFSRVISILGSFSPFFEAFVIQVYSGALLNNLQFGNAAYLSTGRAVSTSRMPFYQLYNRYSQNGINRGVLFLIMTLLLSTMGFHIYLLFFWLITVSYALGPFIFNPHQFILKDFVIDYKNTLKFFYGGHDKWVNDSWAALTRTHRIKFTGLSGLYPRARLRVFFVENLLVDVCHAILYVFVFVQFMHSGNDKVRAQILVAFALIPMAANLGIAVMMFFINFIVGLVFSSSKKSHAKVTAGIGYTLGTLGLVGTVFVYWNWVPNFQTMLVLFLPFAAIQNAAFTLVYFVLPPDQKDGATHIAFWSGHWFQEKFGFNLFIYPIREIIVQCLEITRFSNDFMISNILYWLMLPVCFIPYINRMHTSMLLWVDPSEIVNSRRVTSVADLSARRKQFTLYGLISLSILGIFVALLVTPPVIPSLKNTISSWFEDITLFKEPVAKGVNDNIYGDIIFSQ